MPKHGPRLGSRRQIAVRTPICCKASPSPTVVVVFPSPAGVGVMAVTKINFPDVFCSLIILASNLILALFSPKFISWLGDSFNLEEANSVMGMQLASREISRSVLGLLCCSCEYDIHS